MTSLPISLPDGFSLQIKEGEKISVGQVLATRTRENKVTVELAELLDVSGRKAKRLLKKRPGDIVLPGDILAMKKQFLSRKLVKSNVGGIISDYDRSTGTLTILQQDVTVKRDNTDGEIMKNDASTESIKSPIDGTVAMCNNEQIVIETDKDVVPADDAIGSTAQGELLLFTIDDKDVMAHELDVSIIGKVLYGGRFSREVLLKAIGMEAAGILGHYISTEDLAYITKRNIQTPVLVINPDFGKTIISWKGKTVYVSGNTKSILLLNT